MKRTQLHLATMLAVFLTASAAFADYEQDIVRQLQDMGFTQVEVTRTLLGRVRITAAGADGTREIILNPNTGEILRDLWLRQDGRSSDRALLDGRERDDTGTSGRSGSSSGSSSGSDDEDDDSNDNSGSGSSGNSDKSGNSGSSGSGSSGKSGGGSDDNSGNGGDDDDDD
jgi:hypothetical protein